MNEHIIVTILYGNQFDCGGGFALRLVGAGLTGSILPFQTPRMDDILTNGSGLSLKTVFQLTE